MTLRGNALWRIFENHFVFIIMPLFRMFVVFFLALLALPVLLPFNAIGQAKTPIDFQADNMRFDRNLAPDARRLIGNVQFMHQGTSMTSDSAHLFAAQNRLIAFENIFIQVNDTVTLRGNRLVYNGNTRIAELTGNVILTDPQMTLTTNHLIYDLNRNTANFTGGGTIVNASNTLSSVWGFYFVDEKIFLFRDNVHLKNPDYEMHSDTLRYNTLTEVAYFYGPTTITSEENTIRCKNGWYDTRNEIAHFGRGATLEGEDQTITGDSLFYNRNLGFGRAVGNIIINDSLRNSTITGDLAKHFEKEGLSIVTGRALLTVVSEGDSLFLHADTLRSINLEDQEQQFVFAYNRARFFRQDLQGLADSIVYNFQDSTIYLFHNPILWSDVHQLTARRMEILTSDEAIVRAYLYEAAFIASREGDVGFNQIKGRNIVGHFSDNKIRRIDVQGNAETLYYVEEEDGTIVGLNKALSHRILIGIEEAEISEIRFLDSPEASLIPMEELSDEDRFLLHFEWHEALRPNSKQDVFNEN